MFEKLKTLLKKIEILWEQLEEEEKKDEKVKGIYSFLGKNPKNINGLPLNRWGIDTEGNMYGTTTTRRRDY
ncbi:hypothetical protein ACPEEL_06080 [Pasteurella sp. PK-2025]|uniref:hypothetical protein n=1 Tax=unclassified Pasteurella TaxID=2621516 RepID=UPI003C70C60B